MSFRPAFTVFEDAASSTPPTTGVGLKKRPRNDGALGLADLPFSPPEKRPRSAKVIGRSDNKIRIAFTDITNTPSSTSTPFSLSSKTSVPFSPSSLPLKKKKSLDVLDENLSPSSSTKSTPATKSTIKTEPTPTTQETQEDIDQEGINVFGRFYLGNQIFASDRHALSSKNIRAILNVSKEVRCFFSAPSFTPLSPSREPNVLLLSKSLSPSPSPSRLPSITSIKPEPKHQQHLQDDDTNTEEEQQEHIIRYARIPLEDSSEAPLLEYFYSATDFLHQTHLETDGNLMVHCQLGRSRSPSVLIAYAVRFLGWSLERAYHHFEKVQPRLQINDGFKRQLMTWERLNRPSISGVPFVNSIDFFARTKRKATLSVLSPSNR